MKQINNLKNNFYSFISFDEPKNDAYSFDYWFQRHYYYHQQVVSFYQSIVPSTSSVLHIQCKNGYILEGLNVAKAIGVESDKVSLSIARKRYPQYQFYTAINEVPLQKFDYIVLSFATMETEDIHHLLMAIQKFCHQDTRIIIESYRLLWAPILWITQKLGLRRPTRLKNWVSTRDLQGFISLAGLQTITTGNYMLMPIRIPIISWFLNTFIAHLPIVNRLCLHQWVLVRPQHRVPKEAPLVSVIIPCRNEKGNVEAAITRTPLLGKHTEFIFVEGHSGDGTFEEIERIKNVYAQMDISCYKQEGKGKGDAVRKGFSHARGDILIILDGDLTVPPEEMQKFYDTLINGYAEFVNGSRLVYGMESQAMGFLAWLANHGFGWIISWIIGQPITDTLCGTKVMWKKDYELIAANRNAMGLWDPFGDFDLLFGAAKINLKIVDVPIHYKRRTYGTTNIFRSKEVWFLIWMCMRAWRLLRVRI